MRSGLIQGLLLSLLGHSAVIGSCLIVASTQQSASRGVPVIEVSIENFSVQRMGTLNGTTASMPVIDEQEHSPITVPPDLLPSEIVVPKERPQTKPKAPTKVKKKEQKKKEVPTEGESRGVHDDQTSQLGSPLALNSEGAARASGPSGSGGNSQARENYLSLIGAALAQNKRYPMMARKQGVEGIVRLDLDINRDGTLRKVELQITSGSDLLDRAAIEMAERSAPFAALPSTISGDYLHVSVPVVFKLRN